MYICPDKYREDRFRTISRRLDQNDTSTSRRVPPMVLVGHTRTGKAAALEEIAASLPGYFAARGEPPVTVILVTFNEYSRVSPVGEHDILQERYPPLVDNLYRAIKYLNRELDGSMKAYYLGLLPGLIYDFSSTQPPFGKLITAVNSLNELPMTEKELGFVSIMGSFCSGLIRDVPRELHSLLVARSVSDFGSKQTIAKISWVPFIREFLSANVVLTPNTWLDKARANVIAMCEGFLTAKAATGE